MFSTNGGKFRLRIIAHPLQCLFALVLIGPMLVECQKKCDEKGFCLVCTASANKDDYLKPDDKLPYKNCYSPAKCGGSETPAYDLAADQYCEHATCFIKTEGSTVTRGCDDPKIAKGTCPDSATAGEKVTVSFEDPARKTACTCTSDKRMCNIDHVVTLYTKPTPAPTTTPDPDAGASVFPITLQVSSLVSLSMFLRILASSALN